MVQADCSELTAVCDVRCMMILRLDTDEEYLCDMFGAGMIVYR